MFTSPSHSCATQGTDTAITCNCLLRSDLSQDHHVSRICVGCYYWLCQFWPIQRWLTPICWIQGLIIQQCSCWCTKYSNRQVKKCAECCHTHRHQHLKAWLQPGSNTAGYTSLVQHSRSGVLQASSDSFHWNLNGHAPPYLTDYWFQVAGADTQRHMHSPNNQLLLVPHFRLNTYGHWAIAVAGTTVWNSVTDFIWDPTISADLHMLT